MGKAKKVPRRSEIRPEDTWDLSELYASEAAWERAFRQLEKRIPEFAGFKGTLKKSARALRDCCQFEMDFNRQAEKIGSYAFLKSTEDVANPTYQGMMARYVNLATRAEEAASFIAPEIRAIPRKTMAAFLASPDLGDYRFFLEKLLRYRPHILSVKEERVLAMQGEVAGSARKIFGQLNDADLTFGTVRNEDGDTVELTQSSFRSLLESPKRSVRKQAFTKLYAGYEQHANTLAATLSSSVLQEIYQARVRNYPSALEASLFSDHVPLRVYNALIEAVHDHLDVVYRYHELRRRAMKLRDIHHYDTYVPIVRPKRVKISYEEAAATTCEALKPLGASYCRALEAGLRGRWVDRYENKGKRSGAFSAGSYEGPPYILMNYRDDVIDSMFTLAHEAGHSMHSYYSARKQPYQYYDYVIFVAEVASTFNEQLLNKHLLAQAKDKTTRAFLVNKEIDEIRGTLIRQTMFAEFEKIIHAIAEAGNPLTVDVLRGEYLQILKRYFGPDFAIDEALSLECLRIPHFYYGFYVYKYATGLSAAIALSERVLNGGRPEREAYLRFLESGCSKYPLDLLRDAGVDLERPEPVAAAMDRFRELVDELEQLL